MLARDVMTSPVVCVSPEASTREVARLLLEKGFSGAPVVDRDGHLMGFVSEGDLIAPPDAEREAQRERWLARLAEGERLAGDFLAHIAESGPRTAGAVMSAPAIAASELTAIADIAKLLAQHHIKRIPITRDGVVVGVVSRVDILRAVSDPEFNRVSPAQAHHPVVVERVPPPAAPVLADGAPSADEFQRLNDAFVHEQSLQRQAERQALIEARKHVVEELEQHHLQEREWAEMMAHAREAAAQGRKESLLLRFPSELCADGGRAINAPEPGWPSTLRGEAAELYARWERELKPHGFGLTAQVLNFPGGRPGDVGLTLVWGR